MDIIWLLVFAAWVTHVFVCLGSGAWFTLLFGAVFFPIGVIHGFGVWLRVF
jgi:hypothetical protein